MSNKDIVSIPASKLDVPSVVIANLQVALDRVLNIETLRRLRDKGEGSSCFVYLDPGRAVRLSDSPAQTLGAVNLYAGGPHRGRRMATLTVSINLPTHVGGKGLFVTDTVIRYLRFRVVDGRALRLLRYDWDKRVARLTLRLPIDAFIQHPRVLVRGAVDTPPKSRHVTSTGSL